MKEQLDYTKEFNYHNTAPRECCAVDPVETEERYSYRSPFKKGRITRTYTESIKDYFSRLWYAIINKENDDVVHWSYRAHLYEERADHFKRGYGEVSYYYNELKKELNK